MGGGSGGAVLPPNARSSQLGEGGDGIVLLTSNYIV